jgi:hypothetical protein
MESDVRTIEAREQLVGSPESGKSVQHARLLPCIPNDLFMSYAILLRVFDATLKR